MAGPVSRPLSPENEESGMFSRQLRSKARLSCHFSRADERMQKDSPSSCYTDAVTRVVTILKEGSAVYVADKPPRTLIL